MQSEAPVVSTVKRSPPGPEGVPFFGSLLEFRKDPPGFLVRLAERYGDIVSYKLAGITIHLLREPADIRYVLQTNHRAFSKKTRVYEAMANWLGNGILTAEGDEWLVNRRMLQPAFHKKRLAAFAETMVRATDDMLVEWGEHAARSGSLDVAEEMMRLTLRIVTETLLGTKTVAEADLVGRAVDVAQRFSNSRITSAVHVPLSVPTPLHREYKTQVKLLDDMMYKLIDERAAQKHEGDDVLSMMLNAKYEDGSPVPRKQIRDEALTLFVAGHETTANALGWTFFLLSRNPIALRFLREELANVLGGRSPTFDDLPKLVYTTMVVKESMRLFPPAWVLGRSVDQDVEIGGYHLPKGDFVVMSPFVTHRHAKYWPNPEGFDPDRFAPGKDIDQYAYFPFSGGPRKCIGDAFAMMEATLVLASVAQKFDLDVVPGTRVSMEPLITLRSRNGMPMRLRRLA